MVTDIQRLDLVKFWTKKLNMYCEIFFLLLRFIHIHIASYLYFFILHMYL